MPTAPRKSFEMRVLILAATITALAKPVAAYVSEGHEYTLRCNASGYELTSKSPITWMTGSGAGTQAVTGVDKLYLGRTCDAAHMVFGTGNWCWANGGFVAQFTDRRFSFPRQELFCEPPRQYEGECRC